MKRILGLLVISLSLTLAACSSETEIEEDSKASVEVTTENLTVEEVIYIDGIAPEFKELLDIVNEERIRNGLSELAWSDRLCEAAMIRAKEASVSWSHTRPDDTPYYTVDPEVVYGENLAFGYVTPQEVFDAWMESESHKDNLLHPDFTTVAFGLYIDDDSTYYWAQEFGID